MSPITNDGGPAFPCDHYKPNPMLTADRHPGMSLRDWLAGQALSGLMQNGQFAPSQIGEAAVSFADATIAALKGKEESK